MAPTWNACTTSIDQVKQRQYNTTSLHGVKRSLDQINSDPQNGCIITDVTKSFAVRDSAKRQCLDTDGKTHLAASKIHDLGKNPNDSPVKSSIRQSALPLPGPSQNPLLSLAHPKYGLPETLTRNFASLGVNSIYPWQSSCLLGHGLLDGSRNLVYTAPTGGGKSLVADILMLKRVIEDPTKKAILVLPYVALVQEKLKWLRKACEGVQKSTEPLSQCGSEIPKWRKPFDKSVRVVGFFGGSKTRAKWSDVDIAVCTIEKVV